MARVQATAVPLSVWTNRVRFFYRVRTVSRRAW
jgi:hypothetical protein